MFKENDVRLEAKLSQTHLTPENLAKWFADKVGKVETLFDPAVGSGQLVRFIDFKDIIGNDIDKKSIEYFKSNFKNATVFNENYFNLKDLKYNVAVANYPFSLNLKDVYVENESNSEIKNMFFTKNLTGKADYFFIIKSFLESQEKRGYYLCFPGIGYRNNESKYRKFLVENKYIKSYGILKNCGFDATNIDVLYLELTLNTNDIYTFIYDFKEEKYLKEVTLKFEDFVPKDYKFKLPKIEETKEEIDIIELEKEIYRLKMKRRRDEDRLDKFIKDTFHKVEDNQTTLF